LDQLKPMGSNDNASEKKTHDGRQTELLKNQDDGDSRRQYNN